MLGVLPLSFEHPPWLWALFIIPVMVALSWRALVCLEVGQRWAALVVRCVTVLLIVLGLAGLQYVRTNRNLTVLFLLDRSNSIPKSLYAQQEQYVYDVARNVPAQDQVGVLTFDGQSYVEQLPMRGGVFFDQLADTSLPDRTDVAGAIRMAMALFPHDTAKRIVVISDGNNNVGDCLREVQAAAASGVGVDVAPIDYQYDREVYVEKLVAPASANDGDMVPLWAIITSKRPTDGELTLTHNGVPEPLPEEVRRVRLHPGQNPIGLKVPVHGSDRHEFELTFRPGHEGADTLVENNRATAFTYVGEGKPVLLLSSKPGDDVEMARALEKEKIDVDLVNVEDAGELDLGEFMRYSSIILANVGANWFTDVQQQELTTYVRDMGGGLIMTGGDESFGAGGWIGSPVEEVMPVDFEIKHRQVIPRGALVVILHSCEMPRGNYWGRVVAKKAVDTISSRDYFGVLEYSHMQGVVWGVLLQPALNKAGIKQAIDKMDNGDMPDFATTMQLAVSGLMGLKDASQRHIIIISDGDPQSPSPATIQQMVDNKITCSTVGIGYGSHVIEPTLINIAKATGGRFYPARNPKKLPQIFVKESKVVRRPLIAESPFNPVLDYAMSDVWAGFTMEEDIPPLGGLVMTSPKQAGLIEMPLVRQTSDGKDPLLVHWQIGLGRAVAFTSGFWPHWGEQWTAWPRFGKLWAQIVRWTMGQGAKSGSYDIVTRADGAAGRIVVNALDGESNYLNGLTLSAHVVQPRGGGVQKIKLSQVGPGRYEGNFEVKHDGQYVANVVAKEGGADTSVGYTGLSVPYSPEFKELRANDTLLQNMVDISGGRLLHMDPQADDVFRHDLPPTESRQPVWQWVLAWALLPVFLLDVAVRRLASTVALSVFVEGLLDVFLLFGAGLAYVRGWSGVWAVLGAVVAGEVVGWAIRHRSIRPTVEFLTHSVVTLGGAGRASAAALEQLKDKREQVRELRTAGGRRVDELPPAARSTQAEGTARYDAGTPAAGGKPQDLREVLGGAKPADVAAKPAKVDHFAEQHKDEQAAGYTARLLKARKRAREELDKKDEPDSAIGDPHGEQH